MDRPQFPVLYQRQRFIFFWTRQAPDECECRIYHAVPVWCSCANKAEPGLEMRIIRTPYLQGNAQPEVSAPLRLREPCYAAVEVLSEESRSSTA
ncbi:DUF6372 family protein [Streptomyces pristinaespiralis]|nr:DUF6372 family protein [Streptomyces pristinaespiralis]